MKANEDAKFSTGTRHSQLLPIQITEDLVTRSVLVCTWGLCIDASVTKWSLLFMVVLEG